MLRHRSPVGFVAGPSIVTKDERNAALVEPLKVCREGVEIKQSYVTWIAVQANALIGWIHVHKVVRFSRFEGILIITDCDRSPSLQQARC